MDGNRQWRRIADLLQEASSGGRVGGPLAQVAAELLGVDDVSLATVVDRSPVTVVGSSEAAVTLCRWQFALGEGPTVAALTSDAPIVHADLRADDALLRHPVFAADERARDVAAMFAFPLQVGGARLGVMTGHRATTGPLSPAQYADGLIVSALATVGLLEEAAVRTAEERRSVVFNPEGTPPVDPVAVLDAVVQIAAGMVSEQLDVPVVEALVRLRAEAFVSSATVEEVARLVIARDLRIER